MRTDNITEFEKNQDKYLAFCHSVFMRACKIQCRKHECNGENFFECDLFKNVWEDEVEWYKTHNWVMSIFLSIFFYDV